MGPVSQVGRLGKDRPAQGHGVNPDLVLLWVSESVPDHPEHQPSVQEAGEEEGEAVACDPHLGP